MTRSRIPTDGFVVARAFGIPIVVHPSWLLSLAVLSTITYSAVGASSHGPSPARLTLALVAVLPITASIVAHELAHALVARAYRLPVSRITLFAFGGVSHIGGRAPTPAAEYQIAASGPILSLVIASVVAVIARSSEPTAAGLSGLLGTFALVNLVLAIFNLLPAFPMDGGRVLRAILWRLGGSRPRATRWAAAVGRVFALGLVALSLAVLAAPVLEGGGPDPSGIWSGLVGIFLFNAAGAAGRAEGDDDPRDGTP